MCLTVLVNCLFNVFAICVGGVTIFSLKVIVLLCYVFLCDYAVYCLPKRLCVVFEILVYVLAFPPYVG